MMNIFKTGMLFFVMTALILVGGYAIGGQQGIMVALIFAAIMNFVGYFFSDKIALATMHAQEVGPGHVLYKIVAELARRAELPMPRVYVSPAAAPNAFATGRGPNHAAVCATEGLMQMLDHEELAGVMGHELTHVIHRDILIQSVAATIAGAISMLSYMAMWGGMGRGRDRDGGGNPIVAILFVILGPLAAMIIQAAISRQREFAADTGGAHLAGDAMYLARALEKIETASQRVPLPVNPAFNSMFIMEPLNPMASMRNLFATHPPLEARLENLIGRPTTGLYR